MGKEQAGIVLRQLRGLALRSVGQVSDRELLQRFVGERDEVAFEALLRAHGPMVLRVCRRILRDEHDAEDAFQATFLVLARKAGTLQQQESVGNWLYGVATRLSLRARADAARRRDRERRATEKSGKDPLAELTVREAQYILDEEISRLPDKYRAPLVLCSLEGLARDEAAHRLGCGTATLKSRLERARELLRKRLKRRGLTAPAALLASLLAESFGEAALPSLLVTSTVQAGVAFAAGSAAGALVSSTAIALAQGAVSLLSLSRLKVAALVLLATLVGSSGVGLVARWALEPHQPHVRRELAIAEGKSEKTSEVPLQGARGLTEKPASFNVVPSPREEQAEAVRRESQQMPQRFLDLQPHANQKLKDNFDREGNNLAGLPTGEQALAGVKFNIGEGLILLKGRGIDKPEIVEGIKVGAKFSRLYILHAAHWDTEKGELGGYYTVNYEDNKQETIPILYGRDVSNWWYSKECCPSRSGPEVAWQGTNEDARKTWGGTIRLYMTRWQNPHSARKVVSIDFASTNSDVAPFCVAMTAEE